MKVCYIWVKDFRNFDNLGLNLSSSSKFYFDNFDNTITKEDIVELPENFFGKSISDVTGIIGKNGSGKSNALELICKILKGGKTFLKTNFIIIIEIAGELICHYYFENRAKPRANFKLKFEEFSGNINPLKVIFFSNVFDDRRNGFDKEVSDISVNNSFKYKPSRSTDFGKQIKFINSKIFKFLDIELPTEVQVKFKTGNNRYNSSMQQRMYGENYDLIIDFQKFFRDRIRDIKPHNKFVNLFRFNYFFEIFELLSKSHRNGYSGFDVFLQNFNKFLEEIYNFKYTEEITEKLILFLENELVKINPEEFNLFDEDFSIKTNRGNFGLIKKQINFIKELKELPISLELQYSPEGARNRTLDNFIFDYSNKSKNYINEFIHLFEKSTFLDINWLGISSGQKAYLNLFSSIYDELKYTRQENLLLCIDEGDLYLHPKWQIEFFDKLLKVLPTIYLGRIQLVLTSHSPFLLSDLPKQNITILDREFNNSTIDGIRLKTNTFGGNLYDLYSEPFFLGNKRTSDFAYDKIKILIESAESKLLSSTEKKELLKLSDLLGDEIIQFRINKLLQDD
ncbi:AAA family ATPase [Flavobacterium sp. 245]|uniref:AAA family ATPase n=1 Tax=Flavobacterium sp. 245 TaxID=2512115 RepID=UPI00105C9186|nr:AAA family ATPase [Flavobacterium sp. 245]TDP02194.1 putative AbiEii toxin of type IV toxin-antitoxin system [Flavobacterium sp. 245]